MSKNESNKKKKVDEIREDLLPWFGKKVTKKFRSASDYGRIFFKWLFIAGIVGLFSGGVGTLFQTSVLYMTKVREVHSWLIWLLPFGGLLIVALYHLGHVPIRTGTDAILESIYSKNKVSLMLAPLIFIGTSITHLLGGSVGREGAALQLGGCLGIRIGEILKLDRDDMSLIILCGMSGVFSALFGMPLTSTFLPMELTSVGLICYPCMIPCLFSSLVAYFFALYCGFTPFSYTLTTAPEITILSVTQTTGLAIVCAIVSIVFCVAITHSGPLFAKLVKNEYLRIFIGGCIVLGLTLAVDSRDYNGTGLNVIRRALDGNTDSWSFFFKILFTTVTLGTGFKGGAIIPAFFVGATLGGVVGPWFGLTPGFGAAIGLVAIFCASVNCPVTSMVLSIEFFGSQYLILFAVACAVSYMMSGYYSLFLSQNIIYSKLKADLINIHAK